MYEGETCNSACGGAPGPHRDADIRRFECQNIIHPVAGHGDNMSARLEGSNKIAFLLRTQTAENGRRLGDPPQLRSITWKVGAGNRVIRSLHASRRRQGGDGGGMVAGEHLDRDALIPVVSEDLGCIRPEALAEDDQRERLDREHGFTDRRQRMQPPDQHDPVPCFRTLRRFLTHN